MIANERAREVETERLDSEDVAARIDHPTEATVWLRPVGGDLVGRVEREGSAGADQRTDVGELSTALADTTVDVVDHDAVLAPTDDSRSGSNR